jgi:2',3'-cyclic-nucleotide 2'-phosphodiesterase (5'-nucleotidase family)
MKPRFQYPAHFIIFTVLILSCASSKQDIRELSSIESRNLQIDSTLSADPAMTAYIQPYREDLDNKMGVVIGISALALRKGKPEAPLNNFVADLMLERANREFDKPVHVALTNRGGLRAAIPEGQVTLGNIYEVMPFENELVVLEMMGIQLLTLAKEIGDVGGEPVSGMILEFQGEMVSKMTIAGQPVQNDSIYYLTTTDFLSSPGRNRFAILNTVPRTFLGVTLRDAIIDKIEELNTAGEDITAEVDGRISFK